MERQSNDFNANPLNQPIGSSHVINSMHESNSQSQPIGPSPVINSVTQDETQNTDTLGNDEVELGNF